ncbi:MAG: phosphatidate cytidylyltransferase [Chthoniobacterales bacterium]|nr:phosphatidate cytidylyltransferase [Chthoniobacterales bacterium]
MKPIPTSLLPRLLSTIVLWGVIIGSVIAQSQHGFCLLIAAAALGSLWEYFWLLKVGNIPRHWHVGYTAGIILLLGNFYLLPLPRLGGAFTAGGGLIFAFDAIVLVVTLIALFLREFVKPSPNRSSAEGIAFTLLGIIYIPWLFSFIAKILFLLPSSSSSLLPGQYYALFLIIATKFSDVGAFVFGSLFGKHLFCANISPKKTWEGFFGALGMSLMSSLIFYSLFREQLPLLSLNLVLLLSLTLSVVAIAGDLAESLLKRSLHTKDSSDTLPGIGGGLDLIDSILFTAPLFYFVLQWLLYLS